MEFLLTYGWAIVVVLIVISALAYFGVLNPQRLLPDKCNFQVGIQCRDYHATRAGYAVLSSNDPVYAQTQPPSVYSLTFDAVNQLGEDVYVTGISVRGDDIRCIDIHYDVDACSLSNSLVENLDLSQGYLLIDESKSCFSISEFCEMPGDPCSPLSPDQIVLWRHGQRLRGTLDDLASQYLTILCYDMPPRGTKTDAEIMIEYSRTNPAQGGAIKHTAVGEIKTTVI
ncbi:hypothetical protein GF345_00860 [Candidatus Woesearchaeota archaeon]|nr:hypothetical protein [Candidatus Woesearchaeota archaeon]